VYLRKNSYRSERKRQSIGAVGKKAVNEHDFLLEFARLLPAGLVIPSLIYTSENTSIPNITTRALHER